MEVEYVFLTYGDKTFKFDINRKENASCSEIFRYSIRVKNVIVL
jgi:hypothetical protein